MLCPKCKRDSLKVYRTYESEYLPFRRAVYICLHEDCNFKDFYTLSRDKEPFSLKSHLIYYKAYRLLCEQLNRAAEEYHDGANYLNKAQQLSFELANNQISNEKLEESE